MRNFQDTFDHLISDIVPSQTVGDTTHRMLAIFKIPTKTFQARSKYITHMKNCSTKEYYTDFRILPFSTIYSFEDPGDRLAMLSKWIFDNITCHAPLKRTTFTRHCQPLG